MNPNNKEIPNCSIKINKDIAYFIGVLHSDGYIYIFNDKRRNRNQIRLESVGLNLPTIVG